MGEWPLSGDQKDHHFGGLSGVEIRCLAAFPGGDSTVPGDDRPESKLLHMRIAAVRLRAVPGRGRASVLSLRIQARDPATQGVQCGLSAIRQV
jgi:hypothetical protein